MDSDPLPLLKEKHNSCIAELISINVFSKFKFPCLSANACTIPRFYGLPKIHKDNSVFRPIVSMSNAPGYTVSNGMKTVLDKVFPPRSPNIKNSLHLKKFLNTMVLAQDQILVSYDVFSMFTSIPLELVLNILHKHRAQIEKHLEFRNLRGEVYRVSFDCFMDMIHFVLEDCAVFCFNGSFFKQKKGLAMGSVLSTLFARIVMEDLVRTARRGLTTQPKFLFSYVDDTICAINRQAAHELLTALNNYDPNIKFTMEVQKFIHIKIDDQDFSFPGINFLDMTIFRDGCNLFTNWYKKSFASNHLVNYFSSHEKHTIFSTASSFILTVLRLSDGRFFHDNRARVVSILKSNSFPQLTIDSLVNSHYTLMKNHRPTPYNVSPNFPYKKSIISFPIIKIKRDQYTSLPLLNDNTPVIAQELQDFNNILHISSRPIRSTSFTGSRVKDGFGYSPEELHAPIVICLCACGAKILFDAPPMDESLLFSRTRLILTEDCMDDSHAIRFVFPYPTKCKSFSASLFVSFISYVNRDHLISACCEPERVWRGCIDRLVSLGHIGKLTPPFTPDRVRKLFS